MSRFHCGQKLIHLNDCLLTFILPSLWTREILFTLALMLNRKSGSLAELYADRGRRALRLPTSGQANARASG
jgi:hypothetical protein